MILARNRLAVFFIAMLLVRSGQMFFETDRRIVEQDAAAAFAEHHLFGVTELLKKLRTQQDLAGRATTSDGFGDSRSAAPFLPDALVGGIRGFGERAHQLL